VFCCECGSFLSCGVVSSGGVTRLAEGLVTYSCVLDVTEEEVGNEECEEYYGDV
jgi:hypothetical protein